MKFLFYRSPVLLHSVLLATLFAGLPILNNQAFATPAGTAAIAQSTSPAPANQRQKLAEQFLDLVFTQQYEKATNYISPGIKSDFPASVIQQKAAAFQKLNGVFVKRLTSEVDGDVVVVNILFKKISKAVILTFDENLKIINADYFIDSTASSPK